MNSLYTIEETSEPASNTSVSTDNTSVEPVTPASTDNTSVEPVTPASTDNTSVEPVTPASTDNTSVEPASTENIAALVNIPKPPIIDNTNPSDNTNTTISPNILLESIQKFEDGASQHSLGDVSNDSSLPISNNFKSIINSNNPSGMPLLSKKPGDNSNNVEKIYHSIKDTYRGLSIDRNNIFMVVLKGIEVIEKLKNLDGAEKYDLLRQSINIVINELEIDEDEKKFIQVSIKSFIETAILSSKGKLIQKRKGKHKEKHVKKENRIATGQIIESLVDKLLSIVRNKKFTINDFIMNISSLVGMIIQLVNNYKYLTGVEKKEIVIQTIKQFINKKITKLYEIDDKTLKMLNFVIDTLPQTIDLLISVNNSNHGINEIATTLISKISKCISCKKMEKN